MERCPCGQSRPGAQLAGAETVLLGVHEPDQAARQASLYRNAMSNLGPVSVPDSDYAKLLALRTGLRHFLRWSEQQAASVGLTAAQHQLLLAIRGHSDPRGPTIGEVADYLLLRHHSAVGLVDRADAAGLVWRERDPDDRRVVRLRLTEDGAERLEKLSELTLEELQRLASQTSNVWEGLGSVNSVHGFQRVISPRSSDGDSCGSESAVRVARPYDDLTSDPRRAVLVDRVWPRGLPRRDAGVAEWLQELAPSTDLVKWYGQRAARFEEFANRYREELAARDATASLERLRIWAYDGVTLVTAAPDPEHSHAAVLRELIS